ncbi:hypothetical protein BARRETLEMON_70 [Arthrobacter phage BarretLemon]|uniref:Uncharacterized protein n=1 Tax=Arthrobacter phage BarretLemon TaxID=1796994 RepID=A0A140G797_9CAUD|nr:hypothetical protein BJD79_gp70 [Arthrobacter phage BarretLemon]AMM44532.1 hypothetical protein BARRETLEMON_70 [Arthrobacter phage BarretLemon]
MADYTGAVWIINQQIDKSSKELSELVAKEMTQRAELARTQQAIVQKGDEVADFKDARDLLMNPPAEPVEEPASEPTE